MKTEKSFSTRYGWFKYIDRHTFELKNVKYNINELLHISNTKADGKNIHDVKNAIATIDGFMELYNLMSDDDIFNQIQGVAKKIHYLLNL